MGDWDAGNDGRSWKKRGQLCALIRPRPDADAAVMICGNAFCQIYFRMGGLWDAPVDLMTLTTWSPNSSRTDRITRVR